MGRHQRPILLKMRLSDQPAVQKAPEKVPTPGYQPRHEKKSRSKLLAAVRTAG